MTRRLAFLLSTGIITLSFATSAHAQSVSNGQSLRPSASNNPRAGAGNNAFDDIVVTARRREERQQDVPVAITALSGASLEQRGIRSVEDLRSSVPSLNLTAQRRDEANFYIRGQGPGVQNPGQRNFTSVATYFAEVPIDVSGPGVFYDIASVQVLKGPQGTLFGRNTTGGAVLFEPNRPTMETHGYAKASIGNYNYREFEGVLNIPVVPDLLAIRLAGNTAKRDGFTRSIITGQRLDERDYYGFRGSVLLTPSIGFENLLIVDGRDKDQNGSSAILRQIRPTAAIAPAFAPLLAQQQQLGPRRTLIPELIFERQNTLGITNRTTWEVADTLTLKNIASYRRIRTDRGADYDGTPFATLYNLNERPIQKWQSGLEQFTEEFQLQGRVPNLSLNYILGAYYEHAKPGYPQELRQNAFGAVTVRQTDADDKSTALFAHAELELARGLQLSGGFRYTWDRRWASSSLRNAAGVCTQRVPAGTGPFVCPDTASAKFDAPTYDATIQYKMSADALVYAAYRHGYKSGGVNLPTPSPGFSSFAPEYVDEYEVGIKADWDVGIPLRTNLAAFIDKYKEIQLSVATLLPSGGIVSLVRNAPRATNKGIEFETTIVPFEGFSLSGFASYLDAHSDVTVPGTPAVKGRQTAFQPKWKYGINGSLVVPTPESIGSLTLSADYSWQGRVNTSDISPLLETSYPSYGLLNARIGLANVGGSGVEASLFATNLTNKTYILGGFPLGDAIGFESALYGEPRMYGASLKFSFGG